MTTDFAAKHAAIQADPAVAAALEHYRAQHKAWEDAKRQPLIKLRQIPDLIMASDVMARKGWQFETWSEKESRRLEKATGHNAECWWERYSSIENRLDALAIETCQQVAKLQAAADQLEQTKVKAWKAYSKVRDKAEAAWDAAHT